MPLTRAASEDPIVCSFHSGIEHRTLASTTRSGWTVVGLWGTGKLSEMPVLGGLKAESGRVGRDFGPLLRAPTPGETGGVLLIGELARVAMDEMAERLSSLFKYSVLFTLSHVSRTAFFDFWII